VGDGEKVWTCLMTATYHTHFLLIVLLNKIHPVKINSEFLKTIESRPVPFIYDLQKYFEWCKEVE